MELRESVAGKRRIAIDWSPYDALPAQTYQGSVDLKTILHQQSFLFYLQGKHPSLRRELRHQGDTAEQVYRYLFDPLQHSSLAFPYEASGQDTRCEVRGNLCTEILEIYEQWVRLSSPPGAAYQIDMTSQGDLFAAIADERWPINVEGNAAVPIGS